MTKSMQHAELIAAVAGFTTRAIHKKLNGGTLTLRLVQATPGNNTFTVTIGGVVISVVGDTDVATTATALRAALNASTHPYFAAITWSGTAGDIIDHRRLRRHY